MTVVSLQAKRTFHITVRCFGWLDLEEYAAVSRPGVSGTVYDIYVRRIASVFVEGERERPQTMRPGADRWQVFATDVAVSLDDLEGYLRLNLSSLNVQSVEVFQS